MGRMQHPLAAPVVATWPNWPTTWPVACMLRRRQPRARHHRHDRRLVPGAAPWPPRLIQDKLLIANFESREAPNFSASGECGL